MTRERRRQRRVGWDGEATACVGMHRIRCRGRDLSATGLALEGHWVAYPGQHVSVQLSVDGERIDAYGEVAWAAAIDGRYVWGVRFVALHERCRRCLERFVELRADEVGWGTPIAAGIPRPASHASTDAVAIGATSHDDEVVDTDVAALDLDDLPTGVFRRVAVVPADALERAPSPVAAPVPVVTGHTVRVTLAEITPAPRLPEPPEVTTQLVEAPTLHVEAPTQHVEAPTLHVEAPTSVHVEMPTTVHVESPTSVHVDPREERRRRIEAILSTGKRRRPEAKAEAEVTAPAPAPASKSDRFRRVDQTPEMRALYQAALRDLDG